MTGIAKVEKTPDAIAARRALVGKIDKVLTTYNDPFAVVIQSASKAERERYQGIIMELGLQNNIFLADGEWKVGESGETIGSLAKRFPGRTVLATTSQKVPDFVLQLVKEREIFALRLGEKVRNKAKIQEVLNALWIVAMSIDAKTWTYLRGGMGGPGSSDDILDASDFFEAVRQSWFVESLAGRAA
jgi:hypothetical protein